jgi:branched-subunit amino acid aminotransferase/4-amino-4-deoxychorismate lyase
MSNLLASATRSRNSAAPTLEWSDISSQELLLGHERGAYTTARTVGHGNVLEWDMHVTRLLTSIQAIHSSSEKSDNDSGWNAPRIQNLLKTSLDAFYASHGNDDARITMLFSKEGGEIVAFCHIVKMPPTPTVCDVETVVFGGRNCATVKDSQWIKDRAVLESGKRPEINELILQDSQGFLYEGLSSNFFVLMAYDHDDGNGAGVKIVTAPKDVILPGTIMKVVEELVRESSSRQESPSSSSLPSSPSSLPSLSPSFPKKIEYRLTNVSEIDKWQGAFITSTSRLLLPIKTISNTNQSEKGKSIHHLPTDFTSRVMQKMVSSHLLKFCRNILSP